MNIDLSQIQMNWVGWLGLAIVVVVILGTILHFLFHHVLPFLLKAGAVVLGLILLLAVLHYGLHLF